jgi:hypothetical protein
MVFIIPVLPNVDSSDIQNACCVVVIDKLNLFQVWEEFGMSLIAQRMDLEMCYVMMGIFFSCRGVFRGCCLSSQCDPTLILLAFNMPVAVWWLWQFEHVSSVQ